MTSRDKEKLAVLQAMEAAEQRPDPPLEALFEDVYEKVPLHLQRQEAQLRQHMAKYPKRYS
jgi:2-oxoisovalerate dehydrogenase E1 component alpha subunit